MSHLSRPRTALAPSSAPRLVLLAIAVSLALGGCKTMNDVTGSIGLSSSSAMPTGDAELRIYSEQWGKKYESKPGEKGASMTYARSLRALGQYVQAVAVLQSAAIRNPTDMEVLGAYAKALVDAGKLKEAAEALPRAHTPERPNWTILSAQGSVADQLGDHEQAQNFYAAALRIVPGEPAVLSNQGLSYAMSRQLPVAERTLREASAHPRADMRVRQNLALVLALQGKFSEAEEVSRRDLAPVDAANNVASIRQMIAQSNTWRDIQQLDAPQRKPAKRSAQAKPAAPVN